MKNLSGLMKQAQQMQTKMQEMQAKLESMEIEGEAGAGLVSDHAERQGRAAADQDRPEDGRSGRCRDAGGPDRRRPPDARQKIEAATAAEMQKVTGGLQLPPGMKLPF